MRPELKRVVHIPDKEQQADEHCHDDCKNDYSFKNHIVTRESGLSPPWPMIHHIFCADAEKPVLVGESGETKENRTSLCTSLNLMSANNSVLYTFELHI